MTQVSSKNPYRPGVGVRPLYLAGRDAPLRRFGAMLRAAPEQPASMRVTGLRGVGKTVLLEEFADRGQELGWERPSRGAPIVAVDRTSGRLATTGTAARTRRLRPSDLDRQPTEGTLLQRAPVPGRGGRLARSRASFSGVHPPARAHQPYGR